MFFLVCHNHDTAFDEDTVSTMTQNELSKYVPNTLKRLLSGKL